MKILSALGQVSAVRHLAAEGRLASLLIESTGVAEPLPVAATCDLRDENVASLSNVVRLDTIVTVVDAVNLLRDFSNNDSLRNRDEPLGAENDRSLITPLTEKIDFADIIILNKLADAGPDRVYAARWVIRSLNGNAQIIETKHSDVPAGTTLNGGRLDFDRAHKHPMWAGKLYGFAKHTPKNEEHCIDSFVDHARAPSHPERIHAVLDGPLQGVIHAKGHFRITPQAWAGLFDPFPRWDAR